LSHPRIHVEVRRRGRETRIKVSGWPREGAEWGIYTTDQTPASVSSKWDPADERALALRLGGSATSGRLKGRVLQAIGWHNWKLNTVVGALLLHAESGNLRVTRLMVVDDLVAWDEQQIRATLLACAAEVAVAMQEKGIGNGCLDWEVPSDQEGRIIRLFPDFEKAPRNRQPRGDRSLLRKCPDEDERH
jgi:hypothetical protein